MALFGNNDTVKTTFVAVDQMTPNVKKMRSSLDEFKRGVAQGFGLGGGLGVFNMTAQGIGMVTSFMGDALTAASDLGEQTSKNTVVFGEQAEDVIAWAKDLDSSYGLSERAALTFTGVIGNLTTSMGVSRESAAEMSERLGELAGDLASFNNANVQDVMTALQSGLVGETEPMRRFGVDLSAAAVNAKALAMGLQRTEKQLTTGDKVRARYALIMERTRDAQGDAARTAGSFAGKQREMNANWENLTTALGEFMIGPATDFTGFLGDLVSSMLPDHDKALKEAADYVNDYGRAVDDAVESGKDLGEQLKDQAIARYAEDWRMWLDTNSDFGAIVGDNGQALQWLKGVNLDFARASGMTVETIAALAAKVSLQGGSFTDLVFAIQGFMATKTDIRGIGMSYKREFDTLDEGVEQGTQAVTRAVRTIPPAIRVTFESAFRTMDDAKAPWIAAWKQMAAWVKDPFRPKAFENWLNKRAEKAIEKARQAAQNGQPKVAERWRRVAAAMRNPITRALVNMGMDVDAAIAKIIEFQQLGDRIEPLAIVVTGAGGGTGGTRGGGGGKSGGKGRKGGKGNKGGGGGNGQTDTAHQESTGVNAMGGFLAAGESSLVGENGPEVITLAGGGGYVTPNHRLNRPIVINVDGRKLFEITDARSGRAIAMGG